MSDDIQDACDEAMKRLPQVVYKGVFQRGTEYQPGQMVTFGGSVWHCKRATTESPADRDDWDLAVRKGKGE